MTYNPAIPGPTDLISQSQAQIQTNFSQADSIFDIDHVTFDNATAGDRGKHRKSTYIQQSVDPTTAVDEVALYAKDLAGAETLYLRKENGGTVIQMSGQDPVNSNPGSTFLAGGLIMKFGTVAVTSAGGAFNFVSAFPNACLMATVCSSNLTTTVVVSGVSPTQITIGKSGANANAFYIAIGN